MILALFAAFTAMLVVSSLVVVLHRNPVTSALSLVVALCALSALYILMGAEFVGMVQVIVYAGAIMVLFLFVIMYLNLGRDAEENTTVLFRRLIGWLAGALVLAQGVLLLAGHWALGPVSGAGPPVGGNTQAIGRLLYSRYLFPFEITSLVLLVGMVGAIVLARGRTSASEAAARPRVALRPGDSLTPPPGGEA